MDYPVFREVVSIFPGKCWIVLRAPGRSVKVPGDWKVPGDSVNECGSLIYVPGRSIAVADSSRSVFNSDRKFCMVGYSSGRSTSVLECTGSVPGGVVQQYRVRGILVGAAVFPGRCI